MTHLTTMTTGIRALAESTAFRMSQGMSDIELRDAIHTVRLGVGAVRIGDWDILAKENEDGRYFDVRCKKSGDIVATGLLYYETARIIVSSLNRGMTIHSRNIRRLLDNSEELSRVRNDVALFTARIETYFENGNIEKTNLYEDRLGAAIARHDLLVHKVVTASLHN